MKSVNDPFWASTSRISEAKDDVAVRTALMEVLALLGFGGAYSLNPVVADPRIGRRMNSFGLPKAWEEQYSAGLSLSDPLPRAALKCGGAYRWSEIDRIMRLSRQQRGYLETLGQLGMSDGIGIPCYGPGARRGFLGIGLPHSEASFAPETILKLQLAGQLSYQRHCQLNRVLDLANPRLSQRELEVLRWIARGKSNSVIGQLLEISRSTVDVYVRRVFDKLGVSDRTSASVRGLSLGLIASAHAAEMIEALPK